MMNRLLFLVVCALALTTVGCLPSSDNPLPSDGDITTIASPYLGLWNVNSMLGRNDVEPLSLEITLVGTTELELDFSDSSKTATYTCSLHDVNGIHVVSRDMGTELLDSYDIYKVTLSGIDLSVYPLDGVILENAIDTGEIQGTIEDVEGTKVIRITDTSANLEAYLLNNASAFSNDPILEFHKT